MLSCSFFPFTFLEVLLLESQRMDLSLSDKEENSDERSYVLLIYEDVNANVTKDCVPLCNLLVSLLAHQMLLQTIGTILLQGTQHIIPSLAGVVPNKNNQKILLSLPDDAVEKLLQCLELSYATAVEFDSRPGLKFLLQKVAQLDRAANLYRQAGAAWTINLITLFDLCINNCENSCEGIKDMKEFLPKLRQSLEQLCDTYIDVLLDKDGLHSVVDTINEKITFIIAQTDELPLGSSSTTSSEEETIQDEAATNEEKKEDQENNLEANSPDETDSEKSTLLAEIERQKRDSICKDREAHMGVWAEMLVSALELLCQLDNNQLKALLPAVFPTVRSLTAHATHSSLRHQLASLYDKLSLIYGFDQVT